MSQIDTFDPKKVGNSESSPKLAGSMYKAIDTSVPGVQVCEHLSKTAKVMEDVTVLRTVNHKVVDEHAFANEHRSHGAHDLRQHDLSQHWLNRGT